MQTSNKRKNTIRVIIFFVLYRVKSVQVVKLKTDGGGGKLLVAKLS